MTANNSASFTNHEASGIFNRGSVKDSHFDLESYYCFSCELVSAFESFHFFTSEITGDCNNTSGPAHFGAAKEYNALRVRM